MKKGSIKNTRINSEVMKEIANVIRGELHDPRISPFTTVTDCDVATDLHTCRVSISLLSGAEKDIENTLAGLKSSASYIRKRLAETVNLRYTPELTFVYDNSLQYGSYMESRIEEVMAKDRAAQKARGESEDARTEE